MAARKPHGVLLAKLQNLEAYLQELESLVRIPLAEFMERPYYRRAAERLIQITVEDAIDCGAIVSDLPGKPIPVASREVFVRLHQTGVLGRSPAHRFQEYVGLRHRIVHDYDRIEARLAHRVGQRLVRDGRSDLVALSRWVQGRIR